MVLDGVMRKFSNQCLYSVSTRDGVEHMTGTAAMRRYGRNIMSRFGEVIDHSEFCTRHNHSVTNVPQDPFLITKDWTSPF